MGQTTTLTSALRLPYESLDALLRGQTVAIIPQTFLRPGQQFALYSASGNQPSEKITIKAWARCELCQAPTVTYTPQELARITSLPIDDIEQILAEKPAFFLAYLRVYWLLEPVEYSLKFNGQFASLPEPLSVSADFPVLQDSLFNQRKTLQHSTQAELEEVYTAIAYLAIKDSKAEDLRQELEVLLGTSSNTPTSYYHEFPSEFDWIKTITLLGERSKEVDEGKNTYQAGTDFENVIHKSLCFLGFQIDDAHKGGAGGLDLYCSEPFPLVGECKAGKGIPSHTAQELINLGGKHLGGDEFLKATKLVIGPGNPTSHLIQSAMQWKISIIHPMSLQKLVELKAQYPGAIDLLELQRYLEPGQIDSKIDEYIKEALKRLLLRSQIVQAVKECTKPDRKQIEVVEIKYYYNIKFAQSIGSPDLDNETIHELLIELSSPLAGYLGRVKGTSLQSDRFYFLRDLIVESEASESYF